MRRWLRATVILWVLSAALPSSGWSQTVRATVVDQTGLPLPGATVQLLDGTDVVLTLTTGPDGAFEIDDALAGSTIVVTLHGFEPASVRRADAKRIELVIAHATASTEVVAPAIIPASPSAPLLGSALTTTTVARLPSSRLRARESLPLLPSVVRGADGLLRLGGARPHDTPLLIDGFDVTDPATGTSSINLPFETVRGVAFLRDPMAVTYGGLLGGLVQMDTKAGGDKFSFGVQGFIPRPRFASPGFGRLEGIFPRVYADGSAGQGTVRYVGAVEYDFERIPVPEVTLGGGPDVVEKSASAFGRIDIQTSERSNFTIEGLAFPSATDASGLSPLREESASANVSARDLFGGFTSRFAFDGGSVFTIKVGALSHDATLSPAGTGPAYLSPSGWRGNWFTTIDRRAVRYSGIAAWERTFSIGGRTHDVAIAGGVDWRRLHGTVSERSVLVEDDAGRIVRSIEFGPPASFAVRDRPQGIGLRDVWTATDRVQVDAGVRLDGNAHRERVVPSGRVGVRLALDRTALTVLKVGLGRFVGRVPLAVEAFARYPIRLDRLVNGSTGQAMSEAVLWPAVDRLRLPKAVAFALQLERQVALGLDAQVGFTNRRSARLATLDVPAGSGALSVRDNGTGTYRELQLSMRKIWANDQQLFVSYVRSSAAGELNDFAALFGGFDVPILRPGGMARMPTDARHRWIAWGTFNLPLDVVVSPVLEWHAGFPHSVVDERQEYVGRPNSSSFPAFMALDLVTYKKVTVRGRSADLGIQLFNATNHFNPRDVYRVIGARHFGRFTNSVGPILRGFMMIKW